jgi:ubiquinol-cytochrome c reductase cytochrome b subunit
VTSSRARPEAIPMASLLHRRFHSVLPTFWSQMLAMVALTSLAMTILSGVYLALFFDPSMTEVSYRGPVGYLRGVEMTRAYASALDICFGVHGGLFVRQLHSWSASLFIASLLVSLATAFLTGMFRRPRRWLWVTGVVLVLLALVEAYTGVLLLDDGMSGTSLRMVSGYTLTIPVLGSRLSGLLFGGGFPGTHIIGRLYLAHLLLPALIIGLIALAAIVLRRSGVSVRPDRPRRVAAVRAMAVGAFTAALLAVMAGVIQVNPIWLYGPADFADAAAGSTPPWYFGWLDGAVRLWPAWDLHLGRYTVPAPFWPSVVLLGLTFAVAALYPWIDKRITGDDAAHHVPQRLRDAPRRTAIGVGVAVCYGCLQLAGAIDVVAASFHLSADALFWTLRIGVLLLPPLAAATAYRLCLGLRYREQVIREDGVETGIVHRLRSGGYAAEHRPLAQPDERRPPRQLEPGAMPH